MELSEIALGRSSRWTAPAMTAWLAGELKAKTDPIMNANGSIVAGVIRSVSVSTARLPTVTDSTA